jgi:hypothetical protein
MTADEISAVSEHFLFPPPRSGGEGMKQGRIDNWTRSGMHEFVIPDDANGSAPFGAAR